MGYNSQYTPNNEKHSKETEKNVEEVDCTDCKLHKLFC